MKAPVIASIVSSLLLLNGCKHFDAPRIYSVQEIIEMGDSAHYEVFDIEGWLSKGPGPGGIFNSEKDAVERELERGIHANVPRSNVNPFAESFTASKIKVKGRVWPGEPWGLPEGPFAVSLLVHEYEED